MINALGRGVIAGSEEASKLAKQKYLLDEHEINALASKVFDFMLKHGYAHIQPKSDFVQGFKQGFEYTRMGHQI